MSHTIKIVFFDIDETLAIKKTHFMPLSVNQSIRLLHEKGIKVAIATGRAKFGVRDYILALGMDIFVLINGQYVEYGNTVIHNTPMAKSDIERIIAWCDSVNIGFGLVGRDMCTLSEESKMIRDCINEIYDNVVVDRDFYKHHDVYQMWTFSETQADELAPEAILGNLKMVRWHSHSCDVLPKTSSKAVGIESVLNYLGLDKSQAMAFGDGLNDLEMFQHVGVSVAMGKSHPELLQYADFVTKDLEDDGIYHALKEFKLI